MAGEGPLAEQTGAARPPRVAVAVPGGTRRGLSEHFRRWVPTVAAGLVAGLIATVLSISFAALIFSGDLSQHVADGVGIVLVSGIVGGLFVVSFSSFPGTIAIPQDRVAPILALLAASVSAGLPAGTLPDTRLDTVIAAILLSTLLTGAVMAALGIFRIGGLIRFIPYPVIGGFLAGTGWLLVVGSLQVMTGTATFQGPVATLLDPDLALSWAPGAVFALVMLLIARRHQHFMVVPAVLLVSTVSYFSVLWLSGVSVHEAGSHGWLLGPFHGGVDWRYPAADAVLGAHWSLVLSQPAPLASIALVSVVSVLLTATALEVASGEDMHLNQELRITGTANVLAGLAGGMVVHHSLSLSTLALNMGARGRVVGLLTVAVCAIVFLAGEAIFWLFPRPVLGGVLLFLGLRFLLDWVYDGWSRLSRGDYAVVMMILGTVGVAGFIAGVAVGLVGAVVLFVVNYSRVDVVKHELTGAESHSNVDRPRRHERVLRNLGAQVYVLKLQGFIFFGTANRLLRRIRSRVGGGGRDPVRFVVLDFRRVAGLDSSARMSFQKLAQLAVRDEFRIVLTGMSEALRHQLVQGDLVPGEDRSIRVFPDLDHGLEWCEDQVLERQTLSEMLGGWHVIAHELSGLLPEDVSSDRLLAYLERLEVAAGTELMRQGDAADDLFFIETGLVTVFLDLGNGERVRLRKMGAGTVTGEMGLYLGGRRSASVRAEHPTVLYRLSGASLAEMERADPALASAFHKCMARFIGERLVQANKALQAVLD